MFNIGSQELLIILLLVFLLFGPRHIPEVARTLGKGLGDVQRAVRGVEENMRRAAAEVPRAVGQDQARATPRVVPAAGALPRTTDPGVTDASRVPPDSHSSETTDSEASSPPERPTTPA